jgi:putative transposase
MSLFIWNGISTASYYKWKTKFDRMEIVETQRLRTFKAENAKLNPLIADQALDIVALKGVLSKKG